MDTSDRQVAETGRNRELGLIPIKTDILEMFMEANEGRDLRDRGNVKAVTRTAAN